MSVPDDLRVFQAFASLFSYEWSLHIEDIVKTEPSNDSTIEILHLSGEFSSLLEKALFLLLVIEVYPEPNTLVPASTVWISFNFKIRWYLEILLERLLDFLSLSDLESDMSWN